MSSLSPAPTRTATLPQLGNGMLVAIDARVQASQMLAAGALRGAQVILIDSRTDAVELITTALTESQATSLHVVCHGEPGCLHLGKTPLHAGNLHEYSQQLRQWQVRDILLLACNVAAEGGLSFLQQLREIVGANIAASARRVGNQALGGSWELECRWGDVSTPNVFVPEVRQTYPGIFPPSFSTASNFTVGNGPRSAAVGDFNSDGKLDFATANYGANSVTVNLGNGTGTGFTTSTTLPVGSNPIFIAVGDFNSDGKLDFATANYWSNNVTVSLGNGTGTGFTTSTTLAVGNNPHCVAVGDFNGDGKLDFAIANYGSNNVMVKLGDGTGTGFTTSTTLTVGNNPMSLAVGDFNSDGKLDFASANSGANSVTVSLGDGTGTGFTTSTTFAVGNGPRSVAVGDFNSDGKLDFATANVNSSDVTVRLGDGTGTGFTTSTTFAVGSQPFSVTVADFNSDGKLDFSTANLGSNNVTVRFGDGTGTGFTTSTTQAVGSGPQSVAVADFNRDGKLDFASANYFSNNASVVLNTTPTVTVAAGSAPSEAGPTNGTFTITLDNPAPAGGLTVNFTTAGTATATTDYSLTAGTNITAVTANSFTVAAGQTTATVNVVPVYDGVLESGGETVQLNLSASAGGDYILGASAGAGVQFSTASNFAAGSNPRFVAVGDFNSDGKLDFATANYNSSNVTVRLGNGTGTGFTTSTTQAVGNGPISVAVGDFNSDGKLDFATANYGSNNVMVKLGDGTGTGFTTSTTLPVGTNPHSVAVGDFNADGKLDFATANFNSSNVTVRLGDGTGTGFTTSTTFAVGSNPISVAVGDFNSDGKLDFATANESSNNVTVRLGDGTGTGFTTSTTFTVGNGPRSVAVGDFNADGKLDFATANISSNDVTVRLGDGTGTGFTTSTTLAVGSGLRSVAVGDFNSDGKLDFSTANFNSSNVTVRFGDGTGTGFTTSTTFAVGSGPQSVAVGDFSGDGKLDFATGNYYSNNTSVVLNQPQPQATLTIADANPPTIAANTGLTVAEGATAQPIASTALQVTDIEQSASQLTYTLTAVPGNGTLYNNGIGLAVGGTFTQADIDASTLTYTHNGSETTSDSFTFTVSDGAGGSLAATTFSIAVTPGNDAPTLTATPVTLTGINEDPATNDGDAANITAFTSLISDVDVSAVQGIAITAADNTNGKWQFSTDTGSTWTDISATIGSAVDISTTARLLSAAATNKIRFLPNPDYNGSAGNITFRAWDTTTGTNGGTADTTTNGGTTAFSSATNTATVTVTAVNDAPSFTNLGNQTLPTWTNAPQTVAGWANPINFGPPDEATQAVSNFLVTVTTGATLFAASPVIAPDGTLTYTPSGTPGTATVQVQLQDNGGGTDTSAPATFTITVPPPAVELSLSTATGTEAGTTSITVTATAQGAVTGDQTLNLTLTGTADATDFTGTIPTQITIPNGSSTGQVTFAVANDFIDEDDETAILAISNPSAGIVLGTSTSGSFTITDDDTAGFDISPISGDTSELASSATFDIKLKTQPTANVTLSFASNNPAEGTAAPATVTFTPTDWNSYQTITVTGVDDLVADGNIAYTIVTSADVTTADTKYNNLDPADVTVVNTDNEIPGVTVIQSSGSTEISEGTTTDTYTLQLNTLPVGNVEITATADAQTEISLDGVNFAPAQTLTFTPVNGITPQPVTVRAVDDANSEDIHSGSITHAITNSADANYPLTMTVGSVNPNITDNDIIYSLSGSTASVTESNTGTQQVSFTVTRTGAISETSTVDLALAGSATNGADYNNLAVAGTGVSLSGNTITFAPNATQATITLDVVGDRIDEDDETIELSLVNPIASGTATITASPAVTTIADDDTAGFTVTPTSGLSTTEAGGTAIFQVQLNTQPTADVTINLASDNPAEGNPNVPSLTFTAATWNTPQPVILTGVNDAVDDDNILYNIITAAAVSADAKYNTLDAPDISVTNSDDDTAGISVTPIGGNTTEAGGTATFSVVLNTQPTADVTVNLASDNPAEGNVDTASVTFNAANWNQPQIVTVTGADDAVDDGDVAYNLIAAAAVSTDSKYNGVNPNDVAVTNLDNDTAGVTVSPISGNTTEASGTATFTVVLNTQPTADVTVNLVSSNLAEGTVAAGITFTAANWNIAQTVTVVGVDDVGDDGDVGYNITTSVTSTDSKYSPINPADVTVANLDNDTAGVAISPASTNVAEGGATGNYNIVLTSAPTAAVSINFNAGSQVNAISPITFNSTNWNIPQTVTVSASDDPIAEGTHSSAITHTAVSTDAKYNGIAIAPKTVTITDNETAGISILQPVGSTDLLEGYGSDVYLVSLTTPPQADVTITVAPDGQTSTDLQTLTFTAANWNIPQAVTVTALDNAAVEGNHAGTVNHIATSADAQYNGIAIAPIAVTICDNENPGTAINLPAASAQAFTDADDIITGSAGNDVIYGHSGNDYLNGGAGDDILYGQAGDNGIAGGEGNDVITGGTGFDYINGNAGNDIIYASAGSDRIRGGAGNDNLFGEDGNDYLAGDLGADTLTGGAGNDVFALGTGMGGQTVETADVIADFTLNQDKLDLVGTLAFNQLNIFQGSGANISDTILQDKITGEFLAVLQGVNAVDLTQSSFI